MLYCYTLVAISTHASHINLEFHRLADLFRVIFLQFPGFATLQTRLFSILIFFPAKGREARGEGPWCIAAIAAGKQNSLLYKYKPTVSSHDRYSIAASLYHLLISP